MQKWVITFCLIVLLASSVLAINSDFNNDNKVDDFFIFAEDFENGKVKDSDFDNNGCIYNKDLEVAVKELKIIYDQKARYSFSDIGNYPSDFSVKSEED